MPCAGNDDVDDDDDDDGDEDVDADDGGDDYGYGGGVMMMMSDGDRARLNPQLLGQNGYSLQSPARLVNDCFCQPSPKLNLAENT